MSWKCYKVYFQPEFKEIVNAYLIDLEVDALDEKGDHFLAYIENPMPKDAIQHEIKGIPGVINKVEEIIIEEKNWNEEWEKNFDSIPVEDIVNIRAEFHERNPLFEREILIRPKNAFGTGHHATTYMMIQMMNECSFDKADVLDYGCGTGILSIWAGLNGAQKLSCIDIEESAMDNTKEHIILNGLDVSKFQLTLGTLDLLEVTNYDVILANINRRVLIDAMSDIKERCHYQTTLLMSGILKEDRDKI